MLQLNDEYQSANPGDMTHAEYTRAPPELKASSPLHVLQGHWARQGDGLKMGEIIGGKIMWDSLYQHEPTSIRVIDSTTFGMELGGLSHTGHFVSSPEPSIRWSDGEVWIRDLTHDPTRTHVDNGPAHWAQSTF